MVLLLLLLSEYSSKHYKFQGGGFKELKNRSKTSTIQNEQVQLAEAAVYSVCISHNECPVYDIKQSDGNLLSFLLRCGTRPYESGTQ